MKVSYASNRMINPAHNSRRRVWLNIKHRPQIVLVPLLFIFVIIAWELSVKAFNISEIIIPAPSAVAVSLIESLQSPDFLYHTGITLYEALAGFAVGAVLGLSLGILIAQFPLLESTLYPYIIAFQTVPKVSVAPIILIWFGFGITSKIVLTATMSFFPLLANTLAGLKAAEPEQTELLTAFTASRWQVFRMLRLPMALPYIFVGLDLAIILSIIGAIVGEFVGARAGLGYLILRRNFNLDMPGMFAILLVLAVIGMLLHYIVQFIHRRVVFWVEPENERVIGA